MNMLFKQIDEIRNFCVIILLLMVTIQTSLAAEVSAELSPKQVSLGEASLLTVSVSGAESVSDPVLPDVAGLRFAGSGQSQSTTWVNGKMSAKIDFTYYIVPNTAGSFTIPSFEVKADGKSYTTEPQRLKVLKANQSTQSRSQGQSQVRDTSEYAFLKVTSLADYAYVGQYIPVQIDAYFSQKHKMGLTANPSLINSAFSFNKMSDEPEQSNKVFRGETYTVVSWFAGITPIKAGDYDFGVKFGASVQIPVKNSRQRPRSRSMFGSLFDNQFNQRTVEKKIDVQSSAQKIQVLSLPVDSQPNTFSGAIGQYKVVASTSTDEVIVGDPITMKIIISGQGNFDRITIPRISDSDKWKSYKANSTFTPGDIIGYAGKKIFEQALIPQDERAEAIPHFNFTYFDPKSEEYVVIKTPEIPLTIKRVKDEPRRYIQVDSVDAENTDNTPEKPTVTDEDGLAPINVELGAISELIPAWHHQWFLCLNVTSLIMIVIGSFIFTHRTSGKKDESKKHRKSLSRKVVAALSDVDAAFKMGSTINFFDSCRKVLQLHIGDKLGVNAQAVTVHEIENGAGVNKKEIVELFDMADAVKYSGQIMESDELAKWRLILGQELKELER